MIGRTDEAGAMQGLLGKLDVAAAALVATGHAHRACAVHEAAAHVRRLIPSEGVVTVETLEWHRTDRVPGRSHLRVLCAVDDDEGGPRVVPGFYDGGSGVFRPAGDATRVIAGVVGWAFMPGFPEALLPPAAKSAA